MSSYFEEHNCTPLADGQAPNYLLHLARLLVEGGWSGEWQLQYEHLFADRPTAPPAASAVVAQMPRFTAAHADGGQRAPVAATRTPVHSASQQCPVCIGELQQGAVCVRLPCRHQFHDSCISVWLSKTNSCPVCRYELATDDETYEAYKRQQKRQIDKQADIEELHDSMYN